MNLRHIWYLVFGFFIACGIVFTEREARLKMQRPTAFAQVAQSPPYRAVLSFDDGSTEICYLHGYSVLDPGPLGVTMQVSSCAPDHIFYNGFEQ